MCFECRRPRHVAGAFLTFRLFIFCMAGRETAVSNILPSVPFNVICSVAGGGVFSGTVMLSADCRGISSVFPVRCGGTDKEPLQSRKFRLKKCSFSVFLLRR